MTDEGGWSLWDHLTGECFEGPHEGRVLESWPIRHTTTAAMRAEHPELTIHVSTYRSLFKGALSLGYRRSIKTAGRLPSVFGLTMSGPVDPRLPKLTQGYAVIVGEEARFYVRDAIPEGGLVDDWGGRALRLELGALDGVPAARWEDDGSMPMQLLTRWYGFAFSWPGARIVPAP